MPSKSSSENVTERIRQLLRDRKISQEVVASRLATSQQAISRRLSGDVEFRLTELDVIADVLGMSRAELLTTSPVDSPLTRESAGVSFSGGVA